jgi:transposase-like protein
MPHVHDGSTDSAATRSAATRSVRRLGRQRITPEERTAIAEEIARAYRAGATVKNLAAAVGRSYAWVHQILVEAGVEFRPRGPVPPGGHLTASEFAELAKRCTLAYGSGVAIRRLVEDSGQSQPVIRRILADAGLIRPGFESRR